MRCIICVAGIPGVGKSTISARLAEKLKVAVLDVDHFKKDIVDPSKIADEIDPPEVRRLYYAKTIEFAVSQLDNGTEAVIIEEVFHLANLRHEIDAICARSNTRTLWVEITCPYEVVEGRLRAKGRDGNILSTDQALSLYLRFQKVFEPFPPESSPIHIHNGAGGLEEGISKVLNCLKSP